MFDLSELFFVAEEPRRNHAPDRNRRCGRRRRRVQNMQHAFRAGESEIMKHDALTRYGLRADARRPWSQILDRQRWTIFLTRRKLAAANTRVELFGNDG